MAEMNRTDLQLRQSRRVVLPLSNGRNLLPGEDHYVFSRSQLEHFAPDRVLVKDAHRWSVGYLPVPTGSKQDYPSVDPISLPTSVIQERSVESIPLLPVDRCGKFFLLVRYVGPDQAGEPFEACVFGAASESSDPSRSPMNLNSTDSRAVVLVDSRGEERASRGASMIFAATVSSECWPERLIIDDAADWVVSDVVVVRRSAPGPGGMPFRRVSVADPSRDIERSGEEWRRSLLAQEGDLPGDMFADDALGAFRPGRLMPGDSVELRVTYQGERRDGSPFSFRILGSKKMPTVQLPDSVYMSMSAGCNVLPHSSVQVTSRPQPDRLGHGNGLVVDGLVIDERADCFAVNDLKVGNFSQFAQSGDVPGVAWSRRATGNSLITDVVLAEMDFVLVASNVRSSNVGFVCGAYGHAVDLETGEPIVTR